MASIRIPFPEKDEPSSVVLTGPRITIGRLPFNTVQIIDRTMSGFHAELIMEDGHYRLHDRGSTNGTFVNGELATDFHLREACRISFGTVECDFDPVADQPADAEAVPTRGEINAVRQENVELRGTLAAVREELAALLAVAPADEPAQAVGRAEFTKVLTEREALKEAQLRQEQELARLRGEVAVLRRDRENLQKAWDATKAEMAKVQRPIEAVAVIDVPAAVHPVPAPVAAPARPVEPPAAPRVAAVPVLAPTVAKPFAPPLPPTSPSRIAMPTTKLVTPVAPPTGQPFPAPKPAGIPAKFAPTPTVVAKAPIANSPGQRPIPKAAPTVPPGALPKPVSGVLQPRTTFMPVHAPGPKGTQRIK